MSLASFSTRRPVTILMFCSGIALIGVIALFRLPVELMPNVSFGNITVLVQVRGGIPSEEVESQVTKPIEEAVSTVAHLSNLLSISEEGRARVQLSFEPGTDMDFASLEVRENLAKVRNQLPSEVERPVIARFKQTDVPMVILAVTSERRSPEELRKIVDEQLKEQFVRISGVGNVEVGGGRERKILIEVDQDRLTAYGLGIKRLVGILNVSNLNLLTGELTRTRDKYLIRALGEFDSLDEIKQLGVTTSDQGSMIRLGDIARIEDSYLEPQGHARVNANPVVSLYIQKETTANTLRVADAVLKTVETVRPQLPPDIIIAPISNQADFIKKAIRTVQTSLLMGAALTALVLFLFLRNLGAVLIIAATIPLAVIATFLSMFFGRVTLNVMTLSGLALGIGMLVDSSIVVLENIFRHRDQGGVPPPQAAARGAEEMTLAIVASTITTIIVFLPLVFVSEEVKLLYSGVAWTVTWSLLAALSVALTLVPLLASRLRPRPRAMGQSASPANARPGPIWADRLWAMAGELYRRGRTGHGTPPRPRNSLQGWYRRLLGQAVRFRYYLLTAAVLACVTAAIGLTHLDRELGGTVESNEFTIFIELPTGARLEVSDQMVKAVEALLGEVPEVKTYSSRVERWSSKVYVRLVPQEQRTRTTKEVIESLRPKAEEFPPAFIYFEEPRVTGTEEVIIDIYGHDYGILRGLADAIGNRLAQIPGMTDTKIRHREGRPELWVRVERPVVARHGLSVGDVAEDLHTQMRGLVATRYHTEGREIETIARLQEHYRQTFDDLGRLVFVNPDGDQLLLGQLAEFTFGVGPSEIWRKHKARMIQVSANKGLLSFSEAVDAVQLALADLQFPKDYYYRIGGDYDRLIRNQQELRFALLVTVVLIVLVLASLFESLLQPVLIIGSVPLASVGVVGALHAADIPINIGVLIGIIMLAGIVVNNAIVLVDYANRMRRRALRPTRAILVAAQRRVRPILMTTSTTVLALLPMALDRSEGAGLWSPLAITVISGLLSSTVLTLLLIPSFYVILEELRALVRRASTSMTGPVALRAP